MSDPTGRKQRCTTTNWPAYNAALTARGSLTIWLDKEMRWYTPVSGKRGRQPIFSDAAIDFCLGIKCLFGLALRQSLGLMHSLMGAAVRNEALRACRRLGHGIWKKWSGYHGEAWCRARSIASSAWESG